MRLPLLATLLSIIATLAHGFEVEEERLFPGQGEPLIVLSTGDLDVFAPVIEAFQRRNPAVGVRYVAVGSTDLFDAVEGGGAFDIAISSAMDLQTKLVNDGFARVHRSGDTTSLPEWARWRDQLFAFTQEPAVTILSARALDGLPTPQNRQDLVRIMRDHPERFRGRVGTYDVRTSGLGYLFATQDARQSEVFWRMAEVMGGLGVRLYCCSSPMIEAVESGELALAYNVLGSYVSGATDGGAIILPLSDYTHIMLRTAFIPTTAAQPDAAGEFLDFLVSTQTRNLIATETGLPPIDETAFSTNPNLQPIRLGPGLMVYLDQLTRRNFIEEWVAAMVQP